VACGVIWVLGRLRDCEGCVGFSVGFIEEMKRDLFENNSDFLDSKRDYH
jgi:hypothetical protein